MVSAVEEMDQVDRAGAGQPMVRIPPQPFRDCLVSNHTEMPKPFPPQLLEFDYVRTPQQEAALMRALGDGSAGGSAITQAEAAEIVARGSELAEVVARIVAAAGAVAGGVPAADTDLGGAK